MLRRSKCGCAWTLAGKLSVFQPTQLKILPRYVSAIKTVFFSGAQGAANRT